LQSIVKFDLKKECFIFAYLKRKKQTEKPTHTNWIERNVTESLQHINCLLYYAYYYPYI